jgi:hypothetical protein
MASQHRMNITNSNTTKPTTTTHILSSISSFSFGKAKKNQLVIESRELGALLQEGDTGVFFPLGVETKNQRKSGIVHSLFFLSFLLCIISVRFLSLPTILL